MFRSQNFLAQEQHLQKTHTLESDEYFTALRGLMGRHLNRLPETMVTDILDFAVERGEDAEDTVRLVADLIDLFWMQYDDRADPFTPEEWRYVRDLVDAYALELEMPLVQYIMERVVEHGEIGEPE